MLRITRRFGTIAIPAKVWADNRNSLGKDRRHAMPANVSLWVAMQEQDRITAAALNEFNDCFVRFYLLMTETFK